MPCPRARSVLNKRQAQIDRIIERDAKALTVMRDLRDHDDAFSPPARAPSRRADKEGLGVVSAKVVGPPQMIMGELVNEDALIMPLIVFILSSS